MISFDVGGKRFNYRVVGVCIEDGQVLLHRAEFEDFWSLPGGRVELMEPSADALRREFREELGWDVQVGRLLWVVETFGPYGDPAFHELGFYYQADPGRQSDMPDRSKPFFGKEGESLRLEFRWFPLAELTSVRLYPAFLRQSLKDLPESVQHVVHWDE